MFWEKHWSLKWRAWGSEDDQKRRGRCKWRRRAIVLVWRRRIPRIKQDGEWELERWLLGWVNLANLIYGDKPRSELDLWWCNGSGYKAPQTHPCCLQINNKVPKILCGLSLTPNLCAAAELLVTMFWANFITFILHFALYFICFYMVTSKNYAIKCKSEKLIFAKNFSKYDLTLILVVKKSSIFVTMQN